MCHFPQKFIPKGISKWHLPEGTEIRFVSLQPLIFQTMYSVRSNSVKLGNIKGLHHQV